MTVYMVRHLTNGKVYVGSTKLSMGRRFGRHASRSMSHSPRPGSLAHAMKAYGAEFFRIELLCWPVSSAEAVEVERGFIALYRSDDPNCGYNLTSDGGGGVGGGVRNGKCSGCGVKERRKSGRYCNDCHSGYQRVWRVMQKIKKSTEEASQ